MGDVVCNKCNLKYSINKYINLYLIKLNPDRYLRTCNECRKYRICKNCSAEFKHHQNQTCSEKCSSELKKKTYMKSCGTEHNFSKKSISRKKFENRLFEEEGINNVWQRDAVKDKIEKIILSRYGETNISKVNFIKDKKKNTFSETLKNNPNLLKNKWWEAHDKFILKFGNDPRLGIYGRASTESLNIFLPVIKWCTVNNITDSDIYIGYGEKSEYFISTKMKIYFYDFCIRSKKIIIEFHGIGFHANPNWDKNKLLEWRSAFTNEQSTVNISKTFKKNNIAISSGFKLLEIWSDFTISENIESCINFIKTNCI